MKPAPVPIRRAAEADIEALRRLRRAFYQTQIDFGLLDLPADLDEMLDRTTPGLAGGKRQHCFVAEADGVAQAFLLAVLRVVPGMRQSAVGSIEELYVSPALQGGGTAGRLVDAAVSCLRDAGATRIQTRVLADNQRARGFWRHAGFLENVQILELSTK